MDATLRAELVQLLDRVKDVIRESLNRQIETVVASFLTKIDRLQADRSTDSIDDTATTTTATTASPDGQQAEEVAPVTLEDIVANIKSFLESAKKGDSPDDISKSGLLEQVFNPSTTFNVKPKEIQKVTRKEIVAAACENEGLKIKKEIVSPKVASEPSADTELASTQGFKNSWYPSRQRYIVLGNKCYSPHCGVFCFTTDSFRDHLLTHGIFQYRCFSVGCTASFINMQLLQNHLDTVHPGQNQWSCPWSSCRHVCASNSDLGQHCLRHHFKGIFKCADCPFTGQYRVEVFRHHFEFHSELNDALGQNQHSNPQPRAPKRKLDQQPPLLLPPPPRMPFQPMARFNNPTIPRTSQGSPHHPYYRYNFAQRCWIPDANPPRHLFPPAQLDSNVFNLPRMQPPFRLPNGGRYY